MEYSNELKPTSDRQTKSNYNQDLVFYNQEPKSPKKGYNVISAIDVNNLLTDIPSIK